MVTSDNLEELLKEKRVTINKKVAAINLAIAENSKKELNSKGVYCVNIMGAPGSGKTTVIEGIAKYLGPENIAVIQGDLESEIDKERLEKQNIATYQINTHSGCHLNPKMIEEALQNMNLTGKKYLLIENVGNLVCPAGKQIGQNLNIVVSSTTEGSDKPRKYPVIFLDAALVVISKSDIADAVDFSETQYTDEIKSINRNVQIVKTSRNDTQSFLPIATAIENAREKHFAEH